MSKQRHKVTHQAAPRYPDCVIPESPNSPPWECKHNLSPPSLTYLKQDYIHSNKPNFTSSCPCQLSPDVLSPLQHVSLVFLEVSMYSWTNLFSSVCPASPSHQATALGSRGALKMLTLSGSAHLLLLERASLTAW